MNDRKKKTNAKLIKFDDDQIAIVRAAAGSDRQIAGFVRTAALARAGASDLAEAARQDEQKAHDARRKITPDVDPVLLAELGRVGNNINQIARNLNAAKRSGQVHLSDGLGDKFLAMREEFQEILRQLEPRRKIRE